MNPRMPQTELLTPKSSAGFRRGPMSNFTETDLPARHAAGDLVKVL